MLLNIRVSPILFLVILAVDGRFCGSGLATKILNTCNSDQLNCDDVDTSSDDAESEYLKLGPLEFN